MSTNSYSGSPITAEQADKYLKKNVEIRENLQREAIPLKSVISITQSQEQELNTFYQSDVNAFIFSKDLIERFFSGKDENGKDQPKADYLMVILSAKYQSPDIIGTPTIVVAGVNKDNNNEYTSLKMPYAADQQPPTATLVKFPSASELTPTILKVML